MTDQSFADQIAATGIGSAQEFRRAADHRPLGSRAGFLRLSLLIYGVGEIASSLHTGATIWFFGQLREGAITTEEEVSSIAGIIDMAALPASIVMLGGLVLCWISYCLFIYRAVSNLHRSHARGIETGPGWAVAFTFIPILSLWKPFQVVGEIWRASRSPGGGASDAPPLRGLWWATYLLSGFLATISFRMTLSAGGLGEEITDFDLYTASLWLDVISSIAGIIAAVCLASIAKGIADAQQAWSDVGDTFD